MSTLTKEELQEIEKLKNSEEVKLANRELAKRTREKNKERQRLYQLRWLHKKGTALKAAQE